MRRATWKPSRLLFLLAASTLAVLLISFLTAPEAVARPGTPQASGGSSSSSSSSTHAKKKSKKRRSRREPSQKAPTPERISEIQSALARNGYYQGEPNGKWDANTIGAMQKFQSNNGLEATGKINALSLQKLGLGSEIAGVSAPKPPAPAATPTPAPPPASQQPSPRPAPPATPPSAPSPNNAANGTKPPAP